MRATGRDQGIEKRSSMWGLICEPRPSTKRPPVTVWRSHAVLARVIGVRAKPIAIAVPSSMVDVCSPATASGMNGSCFASNENARSYPIASSRGYNVRTSARSSVGTVIDTCTGAR